MSLTEEEQFICSPLFEIALKDRRRGSRVGPEEFGCELRTIFFSLARFPDFEEICRRLIAENAPDNRSRRFSKPFIAIYKATEVCAVRDNRVMLAAHRDDGKDDDMSLIFGLSPRSEFSGGMLRVAKTDSGNLWRRKRSSDHETQKSGSVGYDIFRGRCCVLQNAEHTVHRLHWGRRIVVIVTAKPIKG